MSDERYRQQLTSPAEASIVPTAGQVADKRPVVPSRKGLLINSTAAFTVTPVGLQIKAAASESEWEGFGENLFAVNASLPWLYGDFFLSGDEAWGAYRRFAEKYGMQWRRIEDYAYVCRNVDFSVRTEKLSFTHHRAVAALYNGTPESRQLQQTALQYAIDNSLTVSQLKAAIRKALPSPASSETKAVIPFWQKTIDETEQKFIRRWEGLTMKDQHQAIERLELMVVLLKNMQKTRKK